ncbi:hypothetical protein [Streptomyces sp. NPDC018833]|uniref:hypothetical protein n=1 Tax=Streptomyces sp. NPDC018833 TaxID=3365053 RepID=UPI00379FBA67
MRGSRSDRVRRSERPTALLSSVATLLGALFICLSPSGPAPHEAAGARPHLGTPAAAHGTDRTPAVSETVLGCPDDRGDCRLLPVLSPAVLTAPPLDAPPAAVAQGPYTSPPAAGGGARWTGALPRAPDLHVLQVLRA